MFICAICGSFSSHWLHWFTLNQGYLFPLRDAQKESFEPLGEIRNLNYLNFSPSARNVLFCAQQVVGFMLSKLLLPYLRFSWDSLDLCELASKENLYPAFSVHIRAHPWDIISHWFHWYSVFPCTSVLVRGWYHISLRSAQTSQLSKLFPLSAQCVVLRAIVVEICCLSCC